MKISKILKAPLALLLAASIIFTGLLTSCGGGGATTTTTSSTATTTTSTSTVTSKTPTAIVSSTTTKSSTTTTTAALPAFRITALGVTKAAPMSSISITGAGFDAGADISVRFFNKAGYSVSVPAHDIKATSLTASVPAYIDPETEMFGAGIVGVEVIQKAGAGTLTTNAIEGLQITDLPASGGTLGAATIEYLDGIIQLLQDSQYHLYCLEQISDGGVTDPVLSECLATLEADYVELKAQVQSIIDDPAKKIELATITLATGETLSMSLDINAVATIDRLVSSYNQRLSNDLNTNLVLAPTAPKAVAAGWKDGIKGFTLPPADESAPDNPWRVQGESTQRAQQKVKTAGDSAGVISSMSESVVTPEGRGNPVENQIRPMSEGRVAAKWVSSTFVTGAFAMAQDYSAASAATGSAAWNQGNGLVSGIFTNIVNWLVTGDSRVESNNKPFRDIVIDSFKTNSAGILISQSSLADVSRGEALELNRLPQESGLALVYDKVKPEVPESLAGLWTGTGWSYDCCEDDGTRLSRITWDVSVFIISQNGADVVGKITLTKVKQEIIDYVYWKPVTSFGPDHLMDGKTAEQYLYFHTPGWAWNWAIAADRMSMDGFFEGPGPGTWCEGKTFHLAKFR